MRSRHPDRAGGDDLFETSNLCPSINQEGEVKTTTVSKRYQGAVPLALLAATAMGLASCGGSDDNKGGGSGTASTAASNAGSKSGTITLGFTPVSTGVCLKVSDERGLFRQAGITMKFLPPAATGAGQVAQVLNGQLTAGFAGYNSVITAAASNLKVVMTNALDSDFDRNGQTSVATIAGKGTKITRFRDLEGKTVAANSLQGTWTVELKEAIQKDGGDPSKVKEVPISFADHAAALGSGRVDAVTTAQPLIALLTAQGFKDIGNPQAKMMGNTDSSAGGIFMAKSYVDQHGALVKNFVDTLAKGNAFCNDPKNAAFMRKAITRITDVPAKIVDVTPLPKWGVAIKRADMDRWIMGFKKYGIIKKAFPATDVVWSGAPAKEQ